MNRLLKPNTALQNSAQNKKFGANKQSVDKRATAATVPAFYVANKSNPRNFSASRAFRAETVESHRFWDAKRQSTSSDKHIRVGSNSSASMSYQKIENAYGGDRSVKARDFSDQRPFLDRGKAEKSLNRRNPPMTVEQVRELLNKNK